MLSTSLYLSTVGSVLYFDIAFKMLSGKKKNYLLQKVALKVHEVVGLHNVWTSLTTKHSGKE